VRAFYRSHFAWSFDLPVRNNNAKGGGETLRLAFGPPWMPEVDYLSSSGPGSLPNSGEQQGSTEKQRDTALARPGRSTLKQLAPSQITNRHSTAECQHSSPEIDRDFGDAECRGAHQSVEIFLDLVATAGDHKDWYLAKLRFAQSYAL
jgi:hypothetical protein